MSIFLIFNPFFLLSLIRAMYLKTIFLNLLNYLVNRLRNERSRKNELRKLTRFIEHLIDVNPLEISLRITGLMAKSVDLAMTIKLMMRMFVRAGLALVRITLISWKR
jgi:hypothetical protein